MIFRHQLTGKIYSDRGIDIGGVLRYSDGWDALINGLHRCTYSARKMRDVADIGTLINARDDEIERLVFAKVQEPEAHSIGRAAVDGVAKKFAVSKNALDRARAAVGRLAASLYSDI